MAKWILSSSWRWNVMCFWVWFCVRSERFGIVSVRNTSCALSRCGCGIDVCHMGVVLFLTLQ
ncbi:hypothetical protein M758_4G115900 [Ceratodon purpureus]|nr:hypothetical protein M758_4G115900 [Ceratodon purpureus]